jgi:hypothetical protein
MIGVDQRRVVRTAAVAVFAAVCALLLSTPVAAQQSPQSDGLVRGLAIRADSQPIAGVEVSTLSTKVVVGTDSTGRFVLSLPPGDRTILLRSLGYKPLSLRVIVVAAQTIEVVATLTPALQTLDTVRVSGRLYNMPDDAPPMMEDFYRRRATGVGFFVTREEIDRAGSVRAAVARLSGVRILTGRSGNFTGIRVPRCEAHFGHARIAYFVDGMQVGSGRQPVDADIAAIEIYKGPATMPAEALGDACAAVFIWTRRRSFERGPASSP